MQCSNNLKQIALASHNFYDVNNRYPCYSMDPFWETFNVNVARPNLLGRYPCRIRHPSLIPLFFPFIEQMGITDQIKEAGVAVAKGDPTGTNPNTGFSIINHALTRIKIAGFLCPSDSATSDWTDAQPMWTNYRVNLGDLPAPVMVENASHGSLVPSMLVPFPRSWAECGWWSARGMEEITDGLSNVIFFSEGLITPNSALGKTTNGGFRSGSVLVNGNFRNGADRETNKANAWIYAPQTLLNLKNNPSAAVTPFPALSYTPFPAPGYALGHGAMGWITAGSGFFTFLPPNGPSIYQTAVKICPTASSYHTGGVNAALMDGSVHFVSDSISTKNFDWQAQGADMIYAGNDPADNYQATSGQPVRCVERRADGSDGEDFSYGVWADLGCINDGNAVAVP
jgi:hypothetical protein